MIPFLNSLTLLQFFIRTYYCYKCLLTRIGTIDGGRVNTHERTQLFVISNVNQMGIDLAAAVLIIRNAVI